MVLARSWKNADAKAALRDFLGQPPPRRAAILDLMAELLSPDSFTRRSAADLARRVSAREPEILGKYADVLIEFLAEIPVDQWQARGYVALAADLNASTLKQRARLASLFRSLIQNERIAIRAIALEAFTILSAAEPKLRDEAMLMIESARYDAVHAMRSRARRMLLVLLASEGKRLS